MAKFQLTLPVEEMKQFKYIYDNSHEIFGEMVSAGADVVYNNILVNMQRAFKDANKLAPYLKKTKIYDTYGKTVINCKVAFYGYYKAEEGSRKYHHKVTTKSTEQYAYKTGRGHKATRMAGRQGKTYEYDYDGVPVPLIIIAREFGTSSGERKRPFVRKSFNKQQIESAMRKAQKIASGGLLEDE